MSTPSTSNGRDAGGWPSGGGWSGSAAQPDPRRWWILVVIAIAQLMIVLDATIMNIALPSAQRALHFSVADRQWVVTAYALAFGSLLLLGGKLADVVGRKVMFLTGMTGFAAASAVGGAAVNFPMLISARAVQGGVRRGAGPDGAVAAGHHVHRPGRAAPVVRGVRRGGRVRRGGGPGAGRDLDRVPVVAVVPVRERAVRRGGGDRRGGTAGPGRPRTAAAGGRAGRGAGVRRDVLHRVRVLQRRHPLLGHPVDVGVHRGRGAAAGRVRGLGGARARAAAAAADRGRPDPGRAPTWRCCSPGRGCSGSCCS